MSEIKRYDQLINATHIETPMLQCDDGQWVKYEDIKHLPQWISVDDRLPIDKDKIKGYECIEVVVFRDGCISFEMFQAGTLPSPWSYFNDDSGEITHWQPLPSVPEGE